MKAFVAALVVTLVVAVAAAFVLDRQQITVADSFATEGARVGDPGRNLVNWQ